MSVMFNNNTNVNCKELTVLPEMFGEGSKYTYEMFVYIYNDFIKNPE